MTFDEKLKAIRSAEHLSQSQFAVITEISVSTLKKVEAGYHDPGWTILSKITQHPRFQKYTLWLMTDKTAPEAGQIAPALAHIGPDSTQSGHSEKQTG
ncbi:phage repressor protein C [Pectobacterium atrosepticum]|uniref:helix-turn-helix domain-containing protein n=1 Tax=Pectobacterium atrosepticum TaxID=29471 RepID=UPI0004E83687|nr:helix-turn-helix transcriptional regulator [Pectobacterium atrosepticum]AIK16092.1 phage repressor protein C [Pectobacterium atrosepticum]